MESLSEIRSRIEALGMDFEFMGTIKTSMNGVERETWLLEYKGAQFVFVSGRKNVVLGWDTAKCPLGEGVLEGLREEFEAEREHCEEELEVLQSDYQDRIAEANADGDCTKAEKLAAERAEELEIWQKELVEGGCASWENYMAKWNENLARCLSPLRTADIGDMLVEVDSRYIEKDAPSLKEAVRLLKEGPFTLASEDEWEYLCSGGTRTLFRWGDTLKDVLDEIYDVGCDCGDEEETEEETSSMLGPNMLGLRIAYDSYKNEIIDNTQYTKGGDGGCSLCGGDGPIYVLPCYTAFYRQKDHVEPLSDNYYCYRRIIRL